MAETHNQTEHETQLESQNPAQQEAQNTPLDAVKETQAAMRESREVLEQRPDPSPEVPGQSNPSNRRKHPQRQMYGSGTNES